MSIIISEYVEGSDNDKAIELFNTGIATIDLSTFFLQVFENGSGTPSSTINLSGTLAPGAAYVITHSSASFAGVADLISTNLSFDGNDAILLMDGFITIDSIGQVGNNPGTEWGTGDQSTQDNTLRRDLDTAFGDVAPTNAFDPADGWSGFALDTSAGLGEHQYVPFTGEPSNEEQLIIQLINAARANPQAHMTEMFNTGDPAIDGALSFFNTDQATAESQVASAPTVAPLAWNMDLARTAETHNNLMIQYDAQSHNLPGEDGFGDRFTNGGYTSWNALGENVFAYSQNPLHAHAGFYIDWGTGPNGIQNPPGHRETILDTNSSYKDIGIAYGVNDIGSSTGPIAVTQHLGNQFNNLPSIVGVAIDDMDNDDFYDIGEGLGGISVTATDGTNTYTTTTWGSGGYALQVLANATYTVTFSRAALGADQTFTIAVATDNVALDIEAAAATTVAEIYTDNSFTTLLSSHTNFADALTATTAGQAIDITDEAAVGDVGAQIVSVDGLTIRGDAPFDGTFTLGVGILELFFEGATDASMIGSVDDNRMVGSLGANTLEGGSGNDTYGIQNSADVIVEVAGDARDRLYSAVDYTLAAGVEVEVMATRSDATGPVNLIGNEFNQEMRSNFFGDTLNGGDGDDMLTGRFHDNLLQGADGNDTLKGFGGNDTLEGGADNDTLYSISGTDVLLGGSGNDIYRLTNANATVTELVGEGFDVVRTRSDFTATTGSEIEVIHGQGSGNLTLVGNEFDQRIEANGGDNTVEGGAGNDRMIGKAGSDAFVFNIGDGNDIIQDFAIGSDLIDLTGTGIASFNDLTIVAHGPTPTTQIHSLISYGDSGDTIKLVNVNSSLVSETDFLFTDLA